MSLKKPLREDEQLFFIHVPKCAGTTFFNVIDQHYVENEILPVHTDLKKLQEEITDSQLASYKFLRGHFSYDVLVPRLSKKPRLITFLRDPITQFISHFEYRQRVPDPLVGIRATLATLTLEQFLDRPELVFHFSNNATRLIGGRYFEGEKLCPNIERARERLPELDFIGFTEHFDESLELFTYIFNFEPVSAYQTLNVSPRREKRSEVPQHLLDRIAEIQQYDLELYQIGLEFYKNKRAMMLAEKAAGEPLVDIGEPIEKVHVDFRRVSPGMGWHVGEAHPLYGCIRWSGPETTSRLQFHLKAGQNYIVRFKVLNYLAADILQSLRLEVNARPVPLISRPDGGNAVIFEGIMPSAAIGAGTTSTLALNINRTQQAGDDARLLGLCYQWLEITPA